MARLGDGALPSDLLLLCLLCNGPTDVWSATNRQFCRLRCHVLCRLVLCGTCCWIYYSSRALKCTPPPDQHLDQGVISSGNAVPSVKVFKNVLWTALRTIFRPKLSTFSGVDTQLKSPRCLDPDTTSVWLASVPMSAILRNDHWSGRGIPRMAKSQYD